MKTKKLSYQSPLFTFSNPKTLKGINRGFATFVMHFAPAGKSGYNVCGHSTEGCRYPCLNFAGHGGIGIKTDADTNIVQDARIRRARMFFETRAVFCALLAREVARACAWSRARRLRAVFRLNGTSDIPWERVPIVYNGAQYPNIFAAFPKVQFYDYTKYPFIRRAHNIANYHLTFSYAETAENHQEAMTWYSQGHSVAVVFDVKKGQPLPSTFLGLPVYDADSTDLRFLDSHGIAGLRLKGNRRNSVGFIQPVGVA